MSESIPVSLIEGWIDDLTSNFKQASQEAEDSSQHLVYKGMREGLGRVRHRVTTWQKHQKYLHRMSRLGRKFLMVRRVNLSDGRYRKLEW